MAAPAKARIMQRRFLRTRGYWGACIRFLLRPGLNTSIWQRFILLKRMYEITFSFDDIPHYQRQILVFVESILASPRQSGGVVIEAGCYRGISTAKFSLAATLAGKELVVCDSFQGLPDNDEPHDKSIGGRAIEFNAGDYAASLDEVQENIRTFGNIDACSFVKGWFDDTLPGFEKPISAVYLDVDLVSSTRTCIKYFWPLMEKGAELYSQDAHIPLVVELFEDSDFWTREIGLDKPPVVTTLRRETLLRVVKE